MPTFDRNDPTVRPWTVDPAPTEQPRRATSPAARSNVLAFPQPATGRGITEHLALVDGLLTETMSDLGHLWGKLGASPLTDILGVDDLPQLLDRLIGSGGKRIRPVMAYLGWLSASGSARGVGHADVVRASAALELLHLFALVHDDVMDESDSRRGLPTVHTVAEELHTRSGAVGDSRRFGESIAILVGDLAHTEADHLAAGLPPEMRRLWRMLVVELVYGQRRDLTSSAAGRRDLADAEQIARLKSGGYTVERPLELGAAAAKAPEVVSSCLARYGREVGAAFALRDDLLGVWGDPARTGKPAGDDLVSGKPTVIVALAADRLVGDERDALARIGSDDLTTDDVVLLQQAMIDTGVVDEVENLISGHVQAALAALEERSLDPDGVRQLTQMAHQIAWRDV